jgi:hypothetical protein
LDGFRHGFSSSILVFCSFYELRWVRADGAIDLGEAPRKAVFGDERRARRSAATRALGGCRQTLVKAVLTMDMVTIDKLMTDTRIRLMRLDRVVDPGSPEGFILQILKNMDEVLAAIVDELEEKER